MLGQIFHELMEVQDLAHLSLDKFSLQQADVRSQDPGH